MNVHAPVRQSGGACRSTDPVLTDQDWVMGVITLVLEVEQPTTQL